MATMLAPIIVPRAVHNLRARSQYPVEITIRPADPDGNHSELGWHILTYQDGELRLLYLWVAMPSGGDTMSPATPHPDDSVEASG
jgi:hypothetical protein